jgi:uncharacterized UPF0146 family protein
MAENLFDKTILTLRDKSISPGDWFDVVTADIQKNAVEHSNLTQACTDDFEKPAHSHYYQSDNVYIKVVVENAESMTTKVEMIDAADKRLLSIEWYLGGAISHVDYKIREEEANPSAYKAIANQFNLNG